MEKDLVISSRKIVTTDMMVPQADGSESARKVEVILRTPNTPQSLRIIMAYTVMEAANQAFVSAMNEFETAKDKFYDKVVGPDGKTKSFRKELSVAESSTLMEGEVASAIRAVEAAEVTLDSKRREFHRNCFSYIESIRSLETKRPVLFDFSDEGPKSWDKMSADEKEILCTYDNTLAINPIFEVLRSGASVEELGK